MQPALKVRYPETFYNDVEQANQRIRELESELLLLKGAISYLEDDKIPWLERELERERTRQWTKG